MVRHSGRARSGLGFALLMTQVHSRHGPLLPAECAGITACTAYQPSPVDVVVNKQFAHRFLCRLVQMTSFPWQGSRCKCPARTSNGPSAGNLAANASYSRTWNKSMSERLSGHGLDRTFAAPRTLPSLAKLLNCLYSTIERIAVRRYQLLVVSSFGGGNNSRLPLLCNQ